MWIDRRGAVMGLGADGGAGEREGFGGREGRRADGDDGDGKGGLCGWRFESLGALAEAVRREVEEAQTATAT